MQNSPTCWAAHLLAAIGTVFLSGLISLTTVPIAAGQELRVGIIDFYGLHHVSAADLRAALPIREGDLLTLGPDEGFPALAGVEARLSKVPGVDHARATAVCCDAGRLIVFIGIEEPGAPVMRVRPAPTGTARLAPDVIRAGDELEQALQEAVQHGRVAEDDSQGHALFEDPAARAVQMRFVAYAARDLAELRRVLRESSDEKHRALAAEVLGYAADKQAVVPDLVDAMSDSSDGVRNNAMRALGVFTRMTSSPTRPPVRVPYEPFIQLLYSPIWTDRNKASQALGDLTRGRDPALLALLRDEALQPLLEMARWKSQAHALAAFGILGRIAGQPEDDIESMWSRGERERLLTQFDDHAPVVH